MSKPPLWEVMDRADRNIKLSAEQNDWPRYIKAAEIRAVRDWLDGVSGVAPSGCCLTERGRIRSILTAEADRAERGEVEHG